MVVRIAGVLCSITEEISFGCSYIADSMADTVGGILEALAVGEITAMTVRVVRLPKLRSAVRH